MGHHLDVGIVGYVAGDWLELDPTNYGIARVGWRNFSLQLYLALGR